MKNNFLSKKFNLSLEKFIRLGKSRRFIKNLIILSLFLLVFSFCLTQVKNSAQAQGLLDTVQKGGLEEIGLEAYGETGAPMDVRLIVARVIRAFLGFLGIIFISYLLWAGFNWMTAAGEEEKIRRSKAQIQQAVIGLIIVLAAWSITAFVTDCVMDITSGATAWMCQ